MNNKIKIMETSIPFEKRPHREICGLCHRESAISFHVPNDIWEVAVHPHYINTIHCLNCFIERADAQLLPWDKHITFYPTSLHTQLSQFPIA
jgi:hypothetical protein